MPGWTEVKWRKILFLRFLTSENNGTLIWIPVYIYNILTKPKTRLKPCQKKYPFFMQCSKWLEQCVTEKFNSIFRISMQDAKFFSHKSPKGIEFYNGYEERTYQWKKSPGI